MNRIFGSTVVLALALATPRTEAAMLAPISIYDSNGKGTFVGGLLTEDLLARQYGTRWVSLSFSKLGFDNNYVFFYASPDCTGQAYIQTGYYQTVPDRATFEALTLTIWAGAPGPQIQLNARSATYGSGSCDPTIVATVFANPAQVLDATSRGFAPPFVAR